MCNDGIPVFSQRPATDVRDEVAFDHHAFLFSNGELRLRKDDNQSRVQNGRAVFMTGPSATALHQAQTNVSAA